jgi:hypothetical protein
MVSGAVGLFAWLASAWLDDAAPTGAAAAGVASAAAWAAALDGTPRTAATSAIDKIAVPLKEAHRGGGEPVWTAVICRKSPVAPLYQRGRKKKIDIPISRAI